jgi:hypothetical protein
MVDGHQDINADIIAHDGLKEPEGGLSQILQLQ